MSEWLGWQKPLKKLLGRLTLSFEQLRTILVEVENIVNSHPLTYVSMNNSDPESKVLMPQKFLCLGSADNLPILPDNDLSDPDYSPKVCLHSNILLNWRTGQFYLNNFWKLWSEQYLVNLRERL